MSVLGREQCEGCRGGLALPFGFSFAFQPIVDTVAQRTVSFEALVRGSHGEPAASILSKVDQGNRYAFDQRCRIRAIELAAELGIRCSLNINFMPNAMYDPSTCIRLTLQAAERCGISIDRIIFEVTEDEAIADRQRMVAIFNEYKRLGLKTAIDDFGAGFAGLTLLAEFQPDIVKIDMALVRGIDVHAARQSIVKAIVGMCSDLRIEVIAEGVETQEEYRYLRSAGISLFQGYLFGRPAFEALPEALVA